jgi:hypothetical protein
MNPTPKISLCLIAGNVDQYIQRFLDSFAPLVDEIVIVSAIGAQAPDRTSVIAFNHPKVKQQTIYSNAPENAAWPHVDNFAAARQRAFDLASHEWVLWADTDDVIDSTSISIILETFAAHHETADAFCWDYNVPDDGLRVVKDRLVRKSAFYWRHRVHEELTPGIAEPRFVIIPQAVITHMPRGTRAPNDERNLTLLQAMKDEGSITAGHRFHLVNSLRAVGRSEEAVTEATQLLQGSDLGIPERYELLMSLGQMCPDLKNQGQLYLQALATDPARREAYGELAVHACRTGRFGQMLAWTTAMLALPKPPGYLWSHRAQYYGWAGIQLHAVALRLNGRRTTGDVLQLNHFKKHGAKISLLHATRGRSKKALQTQALWMARAADPDAIEHVFGLDADDEQALPLAANRAVIVPPGGGCVAAWNAAAAACHGHVLVQMSDDFEPPMHWDTLILDRLGDLSQPTVLAVSDGSRTDALLCMAILTRARYKAQGYLFHPDFKSMYSDNYFTHCSYQDGCVIEARDIIFEHLHPAFGKAEMDETYATSNARERYTEGLEIFNRLVS